MHEDALLPGLGLGEGEGAAKSYLGFFGDDLALTDLWSSHSGSAAVLRDLSAPDGTTVAPAGGCERNRRLTQTDRGLQADKLFP